MEGSGVTNYDTSKSTYAISAATTEFDEALIQRGIVTRQQALVAKGASETEAHRLIQQQQHQEQLTKNQLPVFSIAENRSSRIGKGNEDENDDDNDDDDSFRDDDDDEEFFAQYRQQRLEELKNGDGERQDSSNKRNNNNISRSFFGEVVRISRAEWQREVNEASMDQLHNLTNNDDDDDDKKVVAIAGSSLWPSLHIGHFE
jgi:hypothetical protein